MTTGQAQQRIGHRRSDTFKTVWRILSSFIPLIAPIFIVLVWEALVRGDVRIGDTVLFEFEPVLNEAFFARPTQIWEELKYQYRSERGTIVEDLWASSYRVIYGFVLGVVPAIILGLLMGSQRFIYQLFEPLAEALYATPKIAFLPLVIFLYGLGDEGLVRIVSFSVFFLVLLSVVKSMNQIDPKYREIARSFGANPIQVFFSVTLPASMPGILTSLQLGMGFALVVLVGAEFFAGNQNGIGYRIWRSRELYNIERYFAFLVAAGGLGYMLSIVVNQISRQFTPWIAAPRKPNPTWLQQRLSLFWIAVRPWSFAATLVPIAVGSAIAGYDQVTTDNPDWAFNWFHLGLALVGAIAFQAGTNLVNDYYDHVKGADNESSLGIGGVIQRGDLSARFVLLYGLACFIFGSAIGLYFVSVAGEFILIIGILSVLAGFFYTASPFALAYIGLGEVTVGVFMGPIIVIGAYYVQVQAVSSTALLSSIPIAFLVAAILHANNLRDLETDRAVGKRTVATMLGRERANWEYYGLVGGAYLLQVMLVMVGIVPIYTLVILLSLPAALSLIYRVAANTEPAALNPVLRRTAQLHLRLGLLLTLAWIYAIAEAAYQATFS